ncbi:MAG: cytochrome c biogenesis protein CcsA [Fimbriimonadaceae bacterium]|nr:cytochrome c biogenesis protein CcsA [Fimbriimonadaceae bacterium]
MEHNHSIPAWALTLGDVGRVAVWAALSSFLLSVFFAIRSQDRWSRLAFKFGAGFLFGVFGLLISLFLTNQYGFLYVHNHSQADYEVWYKISGVWAGQEGSILLWSCLTGLFGLITQTRFGSYSRWYVGAYALLMAAMTGISAFESPFRLMMGPDGAPFMPEDGRGMMPSLVNYWMVIHPPTIFVGFSLTAVAYCLAVAAMLHRNPDDWIAMVRPWALTCLGILGLGLCMGGFWAYETLGWGGFWVWDPVENTSFVPWCATAAFTHGIFVQQARNRGHVLNVILGGAPFMLFCYGTFLTRSGFLGDTSVHSFARMDPQALGILVALIGLSTLGFAAVLIPFARWWKKEKPVSETIEKTPWNRSVFFGLAMWLLFAFGLVTAIGMSVPLIQSLLGQSPKVVEESLYNRVLGWFFVPSMLAIGIAPFLTWRGLPARQMLAKIVNPTALALMFTGFLLLWTKTGWQGGAADPEQTTTLIGSVTVPRLPWIAFLAFLCLFAIFTNLVKLGELMPKGRKTAGGVVTHVGVVVALLGLIFSRGLEQKKLLTVHPEKPTEAFGYQISYDGPTRNFMDRNNQVRLSVDGARDRFDAVPGLYFRPGPDGPQETIWPHIQRRPLYDLYFTLHPMVWEASEDQGLTVGQEARYENVIITYLGLRTEGTPGTGSARFFADTKVQVLGDPQALRPSLLLGTQSADPRPARLLDGRTLTMVRADVERNAIVVVLSSRPEEPMSLVQGSSIETDGIRITFQQLRPEAGSDPTTARLGADLLVEPVVSTSRVSPWMGLEDGEKVKVSEMYQLALARIDAATKQAFYRFDYVQPAYPLEVFYKPLTWLVWFGVGLMTVGALWAASGRKPGPRDPRPGTKEPDEAEKERTVEPADASLPVA